ncbi:SCO6881 family protein [Streptomyces carpaticus]|uniref:ATP-binding protein n=1 Tax=Streptomyces carpaticus TaxID=285558 RepID=A0ABV4ZGV5_9ACTN
MGPCDLPVVNVVCDVAGEVISSAGGSVASGIGSWLGAWIASSMGELAAGAADLAVRAVDATTTVDLNAGWFRDNYELLLPIGLVLTVGTFCLQLILAAWRRDDRALAQALFGTMTGVLFSFAAISVTTVALTVVDALSAGLFQVAGTSMEDAVRRVIRVSQFGQMYSMGWAIPALVALGCAIGAFLYWGVMVARKVGILIMVTLAVFAGAGGGWEVAKRWRRGWIEATATLVVSKLLMTIVFLVGVSALGDSEPQDGLAALSDAMAGIVVLVLVLLCPYATYKFVQWAGDGAGGNDLHRSGVAGLAVATGAAKTAGMLAVQAKTGGRAPQGPAQVPGTNKNGVASGINPAGSTPDPLNSLTPPKQTNFGYGENPNATGDKGQALIQRPRTGGDQGQPLIRRPGQRAQSAAPPSSADSASLSAPATTYGTATPGPPPQGSATAEPPRKPLGS